MPCLQRAVSHAAQSGQRIIGGGIEGVAGFQDDLQLALTASGLETELDQAPSALGPEIIQAHEEIAVYVHILRCLSRNIKLLGIPHDIQGCEPDRNDTDQCQNGNEDEANRYAKHRQPRVAKNSKPSLHDAQSFAFQVKTLHL
ncbi:hypothetical protein [Methylobacterium sp. SI9]|uniref:hypothetical protein n=1 Tax=Methylobacterium guangdongense TaxID=3138811 RepID=UPI00313E40A9